MAVLKVPSKQVYCFKCKEFRTVPLQDTQCPHCHAKFKYAPVDYLTIKRKYDVCR
jgi:Zn finger protein HypA/HybF involved in hydrogenase expression